MRGSLPEDRGFKRRPRILDYLGAGRLPEDEAQETAESIVRSVRGPEGHRIIEGEAPTPEEVRARREAKTRRE